MRKRIVRITMCALLLTLATAVPARADWILTPFAGMSFGGETQKQHLSFGTSLTWMSKKIIGFEIDASYSPDLLDSDTAVNFDRTDSSVSTLMGNLILGGSGNFRPYVSVGAGLLKVQVSDISEAFDLNENSFGVNAGAGIIGLVGDHFGLRVDARYIRRLHDTDMGSGIDPELGSFHFWRASLGASFRF